MFVNVTAHSLIERANYYSLSGVDSGRRCSSADWLPKLSNRKKGLIIASGRRMFALVCEELVDNSQTTGPLLRNRIDDWPSHVSLPNNVI